MGRSGTRLTIREIAAAAGVSISTVSRALRREAAEGDETTERIRRIARELDYTPNTLAKGLRQSRSRAIGVVFNDLNNPFYTEILGEIGERLNEADYSLVICYSHYDVERERRNILSLLSRRVDGMIISPIDERSSNIDVLVENGVETVVIDSFPYLPGLSYVYTDHNIGIQLAAEHLIENNHRRILLITAPHQEVGRAERVRAAFAETLEKHGIPPRPDLVVQSPENTIGAGYQTFRRIVTEAGGPGKLPFTAVVAISDLLAAGIYTVANEMEMRIPQDFSIVGYDNIEMTGALSPPLTTVHQSRRRIGAESVKVLLTNIENETKDVRRVSFDPRLVVRKSVRKLQES